MPMTEYETAYLAHLAVDLAFRREQEAAQHKRHADTQAYGAQTQAYGQHALVQAQAHHVQRMAASAAETAAQNARASAETRIAQAAITAAAAQENAARMLIEDPTTQMLEAVVARIDRRTGPSGKADVVQAVDDVVAALKELRSRTERTGSAPQR